MTIRERCLVPTYTGRLVDINDFKPSDFSIDDAVHQLSQINRWNGGTKQPIPVAQHSWNVSRLGATLEEEYWGLVHDTPETYLGDISRPLRQLIPWIDEVEQRILQAIGEALDLTWPVPEAVWRNDNRVMNREVIDQTQFLPIELQFMGNVEPAESSAQGVAMTGWGPSLARERFHTRFMELSYRWKNRTKGAA